MSIYAELAQSARMTELEDANDKLHGEVTHWRGRARDYGAAAHKRGVALDDVRAVIAGYDTGIFRDTVTAFDAIRKIAEGAK